MTRQTKRLLLGLIDAILIGLSFTTAYLFLNLDFTRPLSFYFVFYGAVTLIYLIIGSKMNVFSRLNRYTNTKEIFSIFAAATIATFTGFLATFFLPNTISLRVMLLTYLFNVLLIPASRLGWRYLMEHRARTHRNSRTPKRTLVIGAGDGANVLFRRLELEQEEYRMVGVVDDDAHKRNTYLFGVPVVGTIDDIPNLVLGLKVEHAIVAIPSLKTEELERIVEICSSANITVNSLPPISEIFAADFTTKKLREVDIADLLGRKEVRLDLKALANDLTEKVLLVTGAGGSIGSEICRQVSKFRPRKLILLGHGENSIYQIHRELVGKYQDEFEILPIIADVQDREKIFKLMAHFKPDVVYHAAAHKHVPLMEANPIEAVKNNVHGTKNVAEAAKAAKVGKFVMVSTDKAVNPPNVMGATKRVAEMIIQGLNEKGCTKFCAVRFGNVLGSRGSVVPLFKEQIAQGGPVTVTDFRMTRYFMTIPEASRLVIQAGALAEGGEIFILDMGEPVKILDLAKKVIKLSGFQESQIPIVEAGIRPGEKLFEELLLSTETTDKNVFDKIFVGKVPYLPFDDVVAFINTLQDDHSLKKNLLDFANNLTVKKGIDIDVIATNGAARNGHHKARKTND